MTQIPVSSSIQRSVTTSNTPTSVSNTASVSVSTPSNLSNLLSGNVTIDAITPIKDWWNLDNTKKILYNVVFFVLGVVLFYVGLKIWAIESPEVKAIKKDIDAVTS